MLSVTSMTQYRPQTILATVFDIFTAGVKMQSSKTIPRLSPGGDSHPWCPISSVHLYPAVEEDVPNFSVLLPSGVVTPPKGLEVKTAVQDAGEELSFDDMFENGERDQSLDHRRSRSVISLDDIPEDHEVHSLEKTASMLLNHVQSCTIEEETESDCDKMGPSDFHLLAVVGQGAFGKVFQVRKKDSGSVYAMKVMKKEAILRKDQAQYVWSERDCLTSLDHPYIVKLYYSFQTKHKLYMILEFLTGGHLFYQLYQKGCFTEEQTRVYAAELISAVSFLHSKGIVHRDLKPENVLLDVDGHIKVTDFGLSKGNMGSSESRADSFVGTIQYMAPEVIQGKAHTTAVDWWSIGILIYEMVNGEPPFDYPNKKTGITEKDRKKLMNRITSGKINKPRYCSEQVWNLVQGLVCKNSIERQKNGEQIRSHPFFKKVNWEDIENRRVPSPFRPESKSQTSTSPTTSTDRERPFLFVGNVDKRFRNMPVVDSPCATPDHPNVFQAFQGYSYKTSNALRKSVATHLLFRMSGGLCVCVG